ncbi:hypothetical protein GX586_06410, partial [bacterium]|nr:hypothetical protein [bacterium]
MRSMLISIIAVALLALSAHATQTIRVYKVGSSSFPPELLTDAKYIVEAAGDTTIEWESSDYTRLDDFVLRPYLYTVWTNQHLPIIKAGNYDYVVFQTIGWYNLKPEQHEELLTEIIPDLVSIIQSYGAQVVFYDKFVALLRDEPDPLARTWAGRYPEGVYLNYLLHTMAA